MSWYSWLKKGDWVMVRLGLEGSLIVRVQLALEWGSVMVQMGLEVGSCHGIARAGRYLIMVQPGLGGRVGNVSWYC